MNLAMLAYEEHTTFQPSYLPTPSASTLTCETMDEIRHPFHPEMRIRVPPGTKIARPQSNTKVRRSGYKHDWRKHIKEPDVEEAEVHTSQVRTEWRVERDFVSFPPLDQYRNGQERDEGTKRVSLVEGVRRRLLLAVCVCATAVAELKQYIVGSKRKRKAKKENMEELESGSELGDIVETSSSEAVVTGPRTPRRAQNGHPWRLSVPPQSPFWPRLWSDDSEEFVWDSERQMFVRVLVIR